MISKEEKNSYTTNGKYNRKQIIQWKIKRITETLPTKGVHKTGTLRCLN